MDLKLKTLKKIDPKRESFGEDYDRNLEEGKLQLSF